MLLVLLAVSITTGTLTISRLEQKSLVATPILGGSLIEGVVGSPSRLNPLYASLNVADRDVCKLIFSGLVKMNPAREVVPDLAESWEITNGGQVYIFHLRRDVVWHDGVKFDAKDVLFTGSVLGSGEYLGPLAKSWAGVKTEMIDDYTVKFSLPSSNGLFLISATNVGILPDHLLAKKSVDSLVDNKEFNNQPIGTGPYRLVKHNNETSIELLAFDKYFGDKPKIETITLQFFTNENSMLTALMQGGITAGGFTSPDILAELKQVPGTKSYTYSLPQYRAVYFNQASSPVLADVSVRKALQLATNQKEVVDEVARGWGEVVGSPILPGFWGYLNDLKREYNQVLAREQLKRAGWQDIDKDGILERNNQRLTFTLKLRDDELNSKIANLLVRDWKSIGAEVKLETVTPDLLVSDVVKPRKYEALLFGQTLGADADPYVYWHSSQSVDPGLNLSVGFDKDIDNALETGRMQTNLGRRITAYQTFQRVFTNFVPAILLYQPMYVYAVSDKINGVTDKINLSTTSDRFITIGNWFVKTKLARKGSAS